MKVLSLFDGISCGMVALQRANIPVERYVAYEIDAYAAYISERNFLGRVEHPYPNNVLEADFRKYKGFDLLIGGSPCTYWSIAKKGREATSDGIGGKLFMQYVRALRESGCKYYLYENNYSIHKDIRAFISQQLGEEPIMINSALVSAQDRKRFYWTNIPFVFQPIDQGLVVADVIDGITLDHNKSCYCVPFRVGTVEGKSQSREWRIYSIYGKSISMCGCAGGGGAKTGLYKIDLPDGDYIIRKLTPVEAERLQTLPDNYTAGISDTQRYKCIGNGWTVDVIAHILRGLVNECAE